MSYLKLTYHRKELDDETGNYYYGARYYNPKWSMWLSVNPLVEQTGYAYVGMNNNPINVIELDGRKGTDWYKEKGTENCPGKVSISSVSYEGQYGYTRKLFNFN